MFCDGETSPKRKAVDDEAGNPSNGPRSFLAGTLHVDGSDGLNREENLSGHSTIQERLTSLMIENERRCSLFAI